MSEKTYKLMPILIGALLTVLALMALVRLPELMIAQSHEITVREQKGIYDLTHIKDWDKALVRLTPGSLYYPNTYLTPQNEDSAKAESTKNYGKQHADYLSQRFHLKLPDNHEVYTLTFKLSGRHALRVFLNGSPAAQAGKLGTRKQTTVTWENNLTCEAVPENGEIEILLNSAQFYHIKRGASLAKLELSKAGVRVEPYFYERLKGIIMVGILLSAAVLLSCIYLLLSHAQATLYFVLACLAMALRVCLQSQAWVYFPFPGNLSFQLEYLSVVLLTIFLTLYLGQYVYNRFLQVIKVTVIAGSLLYGVCVLFFDSLFYTEVLKYYQLLLVLCIVPGITCLIYRMRRPTKEQAAAIYGIAVFYLAALSDILMYSDVLGKHKKVPVSEVAMLTFVLAQTVSLLLMNNRMLSEASEAQQRLNTEKEALESLNRMKTEFLGNISHELKTPLTVMSGYAQTTREMAEQSHELDKMEVTHRMKLISSEAERLSLMVGQILDITRAEEGEMQMDKYFCYADEIIHTAIDTHYPILNKNGNRLDIRIDGPLPAISADPVRISQVLLNLISNAVRFTNNGCITVSASQEGAFIQVCVADNGDGIPAEYLPHIFERYNSRKKSGTGQSTGTGLGLYICKLIVEQHGGRIWAESEEGRGASLFFSLPVPPT